MILYSVVAVSMTILASFDMFVRMEFDLQSILQTYPHRLGFGLEAPEV